VVFVGEVHDWQSHHMAQLRVIKARKKARGSLAIGLEMFRSESQPILDGWVDGKVRGDDFVRAYYENWNFPWDHYRDIFTYAKENTIPLIGLNLPRDITLQVSRQGFSSLTSKQLRELPSVSCQVDTTYEAFIRRALGQHGHSGKSFTHFCQAQMLRDSVMAWNLLRFLEANPEHKIVVLAGNGHAWKRGIPAQIRRRSNIPYRVILPEIPGRLERANVSLEDADYLWLAY
jgi:uncharacterized iron-regulated protein